MTGSDRITWRDAREDLPEGGEPVYDSLAETRGRVYGPFPVLLNHPELARRVGDLGTVIRYEGELPDADRELAILATGRHFDCPYEWAAHAPVAREAGVSEPVLRAIADEADPVDLPEPAATIVTYVRAVFDDHAVPDETYGTALDRYGESGVVELTTTMGFYSMIAAILNTFEVLPAEEHFA